MSAPLTLAFDARTMWYVTRATGVVSLLLLTASIVLGVTEVVRWMTDQWPRFVTAGLHRNISLLATTFIAVHIASAIVDGYAPIGWLDTVLPFRAAYRPMWLGLGTVAFDLLIAITITSLLRNRLGYRSWRLVHWTAYVCWPVALVHGLGTGTDTKTNWVLGLESACMAAVVFAIWWRVLVAGTPSGDARRLAAAVVSVVGPLLIAAWVYAGPLQPGWARRAGTPTALLGSSVGAAATTEDPPTTAPQASAAPPSRSQQPSGLAPSFKANVTGTLTDPSPDHRGNDTITIDAQLDSGAVGSVHVVLSGQAIENGGVSLSSGTATVSGSGGDVYTGAVTALRGNVVDAALHSKSGAPMSLELELVLDGTSVSGTASGVVQ
jgi:sulfoxide reductase heme-binding subunit YedZ